MHLFAKDFQHLKALIARHGHKKDFIIFEGEHLNTDLLLKGECHHIRMALK
jgi:hypothetical protein